MAYGFNDDKSKAPVYSKSETFSKNEVYSKSDFVILEGTIASVPANGTKTAAILSQPGVSADEYLILSAMQSMGDDWTNYEILQGAVYPSVSIIPNPGKIFITVSNRNIAAVDVKYKVILLKIA